jgi:hypothetical protein
VEGETSWGYSTNCTTNNNKTIVMHKQTDGQTDISILIVFRQALIGAAPLSVVGVSHG